MSKKVQFLPDNISVTVADNENLLAAAANAGIYIPAACGGDGVCGKCKVKIEEGEVAVQTGKHVLPAEEQAKGMRLACQTTVTNDLTVRILAEKDGLKRKPKTTRAISARSLDDLLGEWRVSPPVKKVFLQLSPPTIEDNIPDLQRLMRALMKELGASQELSYDHPELLKELPFTLREANWQVTVILLHGKREADTDRIIAVEPGDTTDKLFGLAVDIGTTTVCGVLLDLNSGQSLAEAAAYNSHKRRHRRAGLHS